VKADPLLSAFNFANINRMQIRLFSQFFLAHADLLAVFANGISKNFKIVSRACHNLEESKAALNLEHPTWVYFFPCVASGWVYNHFWIQETR
jgi:hypothetical protein